MRYAIATTVFLAGWSVVVLTAVGEHDAVALPLTIGVSVAAGAIARTWLAVSLALLIIPLFAVASSCDSARYECDVNVMWLVLVVWAPMTAALLAVGVAAAKLWRRPPATSRSG